MKISKFTYLVNAILVASNDIKARYKKSFLGPIWLPLSTLISVFGLALVWGSLLKEDLATFIPSVAIGLVVWQLVSGSITEGCNTFTSQAPIIKNLKVPLDFFAIRLLSRQIINFAHNLLIILGLVIYFELPILNNLPYLIISLFLVFLNLYWIIFCLGLLCARYRDVSYLINSFMPILFFLSPVLFRPEKLPTYLKGITDFNPFTYLIEPIRIHLIGESIDTKILYMLFISFIIGFLFKLFLKKRYSSMIAFWV